VHAMMFFAKSMRILSFGAASTLFGHPLDHKQYVASHGIFIDTIHSCLGMEHIS